MNDTDWEQIKSDLLLSDDMIRSAILDLHERMIELEHHILNAEPNLITRVYNAEKHLEKLEETNMSAAPVINKILCNMAAQIKFLGEHLEKLESMMPPLNEQIISKTVLLDRIEKLELFEKTQLSELLMKPRCSKCGAFMKLTKKEKYSYEYASGCEHMKGMRMSVG